MRNLKKILALALALVMTLSVMSFASATTYPDSDTITEKYQEAVDVLSGIEVFVGKDTGNFDPSANIKRSEVAAIIYRVVTADVTNTNVGLYADYNKFTDVTSERWYAGYVNYCANAEYIKGMGNGTFKPDANVTGYQVLAMILRAVGYDQNGEFEGSGWQVRVASTARELGITDTVSEVALGQAVTREVVAELLFRTITLAPTVTYTSALGYTQYKNFALTGKTDLNPTLGEKSFGLVKTEGEITAVARTAGTVTLTTNKRNTITNVTTDWTNIGYEAYAYTVPAGADSTLKSVTGTMTITGVSLAVSSAETNDKTVNPLVAAGSASKIATLDAYDTISVYYNGNPVTQYATADDAKAAKATGYTYLTGTNALVYGTYANNDYTYDNVDIKNGTKVDFVDNDNGGEAEAIVITQYTAAQITGKANTTTTGTNAVKVDTTYFTAGNTTQDVKDSQIVCNGTIAVNDIVTYVDYPTNANGTGTGDRYVRVSTSTADNFTKINTNQVTGDISYVIGAETLSTAGYPYSLDYLVAANLNTKTTYYTDEFGYIIYAEKATETPNYLFGISNAHTNGNTKLAEGVVVLADGTVSSVNIASLDKATDLANNVAKDAMYSYTVDAKGNYDLTSSKEEITSVSYTKGSATITLNGSKLWVDNKTTVVDVSTVRKDTTTTTTVYTGAANIPTMDSASGYFVVDAAGYVSLMFVYDVNVNTADTFYVYDINPYSVTKSGTGYSYTYNVVRDGVIADQTVTVDDTDYAYINTHGVGKYTAVNGKLTSYTSYVELMSELAWGENTITWTENDYNVTTNGAARWNDDTTYTVLDITNKTATNYTMTVGNNHLANTTSKTQGFVVGTTTAKNVYVVVGEVATASGSTKTASDVQASTVTNANAWNGGLTNDTDKLVTYYVKDKYITGVEKQEAAATTLSVTFYGVADGDDADLWGDVEADEDNDVEAQVGAGTIEVSYATAKADGTGIQPAANVTNIIKIAADGTKSVVKAATLDVAGAEYEVTFSDGSVFTMIQDPAHAHTDLIYGTVFGDNAATSPYISDEDGLTIPDDDSDTTGSLNIDKFIANVNVGLASDDEDSNEKAHIDGNTDIQWLFYDADGLVEESAYNRTTMLNVERIIAIVTAEDGTTKKVYDTEGELDEAVEAAEAANTEANSDFAAYIEDNDGLSTGSIADLKKLLSDAQAAYDEALASGDPDKIETAAEKLVNTGNVIDGVTHLFSKGDVQDILTKRGWNADTVNGFLKSYGKTDDSGNALVTVDEKSIKVTNAKYTDDDAENGNILSGTFTMTLVCGTGDTQVSTDITWDWVLNG